MPSQALFLQLVPSSSSLNMIPHPCTWCPSLSSCSKTTSMRKSCRTDFEDFTIKNYQPLELSATTRAPNVLSTVLFQVWASWSLTSLPNRGGGTCSNKRQDSQLSTEIGNLRPLTNNLSCMRIWVQVTIKFSSWKLSPKLLLSYSIEIRQRQPLLRKVESATSSLYITGNSPTLIHEIAEGLHTDNLNVTQQWVQS